MKVSALVMAFWRQYFRGKAVAFQSLAVALFLGLMLDPRFPHDWNEVALLLSFAVVVLAALSTGFMIWQNADSKMDILVLKSGRPAYYAATVLASILVTVFWIATIGAYLWAAVRIPGGIPAGAMRPLLWSLGGNVLAPVALFTLFSTLTGRAIEPYLAASAVILSLGNFDQEPWRRLAILLPPLVENARAAAGMGEPQTIRCLVYAGVVLLLGLWRFMRREFIWS